MASRAFALWCLALCCVAAESRPTRDRGLSVSDASIGREPLQTTFSDPGSWDHYVLAEETPPGICFVDSIDGGGVECSYPSNSTLWTIHGLWPTLGDSEGPNWCGNCTPDAVNCTNATFSTADIADLVSKLATFWPNIEIDTPYYNFWKHEWLKHGTCSGMKIETFFSTVLGLFENGLNYAKILNKSGILPSKTQAYDAKDFTSAFSSHLGIEPLLVCHYSKSTGQTLQQIQICLDKNYKAMTCPSSKIEDACWTTEPIHYIPSKYSTLS